MYPTCQHDLYTQLETGFATLPKTYHQFALWQLGRYTLLLCFSTPTIFEKMGKSIAGLKPIDNIDSSWEISYDLCIHCWDGEGRFDAAPTAPDWDQYGIDGKGIINLPASPDVFCSYVWGVGALQAYCSTTRHAYYWITDANTIPYWETSFPFRQILSWFFQSKPIQPIHAAALAYQGKGFLMPGRSGSGKSTTSLFLSMQGYDYLGDDYVLLDLSSTNPTVHALYHSAKIDDHSLEILPQLKNQAYKVHSEDPKSVLSFPKTNPLCSHTIDAILLPRVVGGKTHITPARESDVVLAIAPTTIHHLNVDAKKVLSLAKELTIQCPHYWLNLGRDIDCLPNLLHETFY